MKQAKSYALTVGDLFVTLSITSVVASTRRADIGFTVTGGYPPYTWTFTPIQNVVDFVNSITGDSMSDTGTVMPVSYEAGAIFPGISRLVISHDANVGENVAASVYIVDANGSVVTDTTSGVAA